jgi:hypothetical protein
MVAYELEAGRGTLAKPSTQDVISARPRDDGGLAKRMPCRHMRLITYGSWPTTKERGNEWVATKEGWLHR